MSTTTSLHTQNPLLKPRPLCLGRPHGQTDYFPRPPSAASAIVDSTPSRDITLRPDIGEFGTFDLQFDVSDTEYDSYVMDTSADMFA